ncbi:MAG: hypothetical protein L6Q66_08990 [Bacteroidia bacterium]|nr:hypothetical protein [Bacteroidia bacterium]
MKTRSSVRKAAAILNGWLVALRPDRCRDEEVIGSPESFRDDILLPNNQIPIVRTTGVCL